MKISRSQQNNLIQSVSSNPRGIQYKDIFYTSAVAILNENIKLISDIAQDPNTLKYIENTFSKQSFDFILIGNDAYYRQPMPHIENFCITHHIGFEQMAFKSACKTYNLIASDRNFLILLYTQSIENSDEN